MPEGHTIHRAARDHAAVLGGHKVSAMSPQGRFADEAAQLDGATLTKTGAIGKHLFHHFSNDLTVHIHLGLGGYFVVHDQPIDPPRDVVRLRLEGPTHALDIIGPNTCELIPTRDVQELRARYGPDLLSDNPDPERAIARIQRSRAPIAKLLMDQRVISGIGNIYRAEILWLRRLDPFARGMDLTNETLQTLWDEMRALLIIGMDLNAIVTNGHHPAPGEPITERTNIFAKENCPRCEDKIEKSTLAGRTLYHCPSCQTRQE